MAKKRFIHSIQLVFAISTMWAFADGLMSFFLPQQIEGILKNIALFGFVYSFYSVFGIFFDFLLGYFSRKIRYQIYLGIGLLLGVLLSLLAPSSLSIASIILILIFRGAYYECIHIGIFNYIAQYKHEEDHGKLFGYMYLLQDASYTLSPIVAGIVLMRGPMALYGFCIFLFGISLLITTVLKRFHKRAEKAFFTYRKHQHFHPKKEWIIIKDLLHYSGNIFVGICLYYIWDSFIWALLPLQAIHWGQTTTGIIIAAFTLPLALLQGYAGVIADTYGRYITFFIGSMTAAVFTILFGISHMIWLQIVSAALSATGFTFAYPAMLSIISSRDHHELTEAVAIERASANVGLILGPILGGIIASFTSINVSFVLLGIGIVCIIAFEMQTFFSHITRHHRKHKRIDFRYLDRN